MRIVPSSVERVIEELVKLPSIGPRTAERLTFFLLRGDRSRATALGSALEELHAGVKFCHICHNFAESETCAICAAPGRDQQVIAVVEEPFDVVAVEKTGLSKGLSPVLGGVISPIYGVGPEKLAIGSLSKRVQAGQIKEVILATNPS